MKTTIETLKSTEIQSVNGGRIKLKLTKNTYSEVSRYTGQEYTSISYSATAEILDGRTAKQATKNLNAKQSEEVCLLIVRLQDNSIHSFSISTSEKNAKNSLYYKTAIKCNEWTTEIIKF